MRNRAKKFFINASITLLILVTICTTFPTLWGPLLVGRVIHAFLPKKEGMENYFVIKKIGFDEIEVVGVNLAALPYTPSCDYILIRYNLFELLKRKIESVEVRGVCVNPVNGGIQKKNKHSWRKTIDSVDTDTPLEKPIDPLRGWGIRSMSIETREIDLSPIIPKELKTLVPSSKGYLNFTLKEENDDVMVGKLKGELFGLPMMSNVRYAPKNAQLSYDLCYAGSEQKENKCDEHIQCLTIDGECRFFDVGCLSLKSMTRVSYCEKDKIFIRFASEEDAMKYALLHEKERPYSCEFRIFTQWHQESELNVTIRTDPKAFIPSRMPILAKILPLIPLPNELTDLEFLGELVVNSNIQITGGVLEWNVLIVANQVDADFKLSKIPFEIKGGKVIIKCDGVGDFWRMRPIFVTVSEAQVGLFSFGKGMCTLYTDEKMLVMPKASIEFCGGQVIVYSLNFGYENADSGFTLELDRLDAGEFIKLFPQIAGSTATGRLYGKMPLRIQEKGSEIRLGEAFLYSPPGEVGNIQIKDPTVIVQLLSNVGVPNSVCDNLGKALQNLDYQTLRFDLQNPRTEEGILAVKVEGSSFNGKVTTPVNLNIKVNGPIERMLNLSLKTAKIGK